MDDSRGLATGHLVALGGAAVALASLWAPWYRVDLDALRQALQQQPGVNGTSLGGFVASIVALLAAAGSFGAGISVARDAAARVAVAAGAACALFVAGRVMNPPGPNAYLEVRWGAWACLLGCALMVAGGIAANSAPRRYRATDWSPQAGSR